MKTLLFCGELTLRVLEVLTDNTFEEYINAGINNRQEMIITKEQRDTNPLTCNGDTFTSTDVLENWVIIKKYCNMLDDSKITNYLHQLDDEDPEVRIDAINKLGESGDELCLTELRDRLKLLTREHQALIIAVGKLKKELGVK